MAYYVAAALATGLVFVLGYHIGNQLGRTAHIRKQIQRARDERVIARISEQ